MTIPTRPEAGQPFRIVGGVLGASARLWWRRLRSSIGTVASILLVVVLGLAAPAFWWGIWPVFAPTLRGIINANERIAALMIVGVSLSYALICSLIRVMMLAFDFVSKDLRMLLATAPLSRITRAVVQIIPDAVTTTVVCAGIGSIGLFAMAAASDEVSAVEALAWAVAVNVAIAAFASVIEWIGTAVTHDNTASRGGAAIVTLIVLCAFLGLTASSMQADGLNSALVASGELVLEWSTGHSCVIAVVIMTVALGLWLVVDALTSRDVMRAHGRRPRCVIRDGNIVKSGALTFFREPSNVMGLVSLMAIIGLAAFMERVTSIQITGQVVVSCALLLCAAGGIITYGEYLTLRWRVLASPASSRSTAAQWFLGHEGTAILIAASGFAAYYVLADSETRELLIPELPIYLGMGLVSMGAGLLAGKAVPYRREDVFAMAGSGTLAAVLGISYWWLTITIGRIPEPLAGAIAVVGAVAIILATEADDQRAPKFTLDDADGT